MKIKLQLLCAAIAGISMFHPGTAKAQGLPTGTSIINLGVGFGYSINYFDYGYGSTSSTPVISGSYEYAATRLGPGTLGLGLAVGYQSSTLTYVDVYTDNLTEKYTTTAFGVRGIYHWDAIQGDKYDLYGGIQLTYVNYGYSYSYTGPGSHYYGNNYGGAALSSSFYPYIILGGRYYFTPSIGAFAELGYDICYFKIGITFKFGGSK